MNSRGRSRTECPLLIAISFRLLNTKGTVSGLGLNSVFWLFFEFYGGVSRAVYAFKTTTDHGYEPQIALFFELGLDDRKAPPRRLSDGLDEQALTNAKLNTDIVWCKL